MKRWLRAVSYVFNACVCRCVCMFTYIIMSKAPMQYEQRASSLRQLKSNAAKKTTRFRLLQYRNFLSYLLPNKSGCSVLCTRKRWEFSVPSSHRKSNVLLFGNITQLREMKKEAGEDGIVRTICSVKAIQKVPGKIDWAMFDDGLNSFFKIIEHVLNCNILKLFCLHYSSC